MLEDANVGSVVVHVLVMVALVVVPHADVCSCCCGRRPCRFGW